MPEETTTTEGYQPRAIEAKPEPAGAEKEGPKAKRVETPGKPGTKASLPEDRPLALDEDSLLVKLLELNPDKLDSEALGKIRKVDNYIRKELKKQELRPTLKAYNAILEELESVLDLSDYLPNEKKLDRLFEYVKMLTKKERKKATLSKKAEIIRDLELDEEDLEDMKIMGLI